jgi:hypothetical protein
VSTYESKNEALPQKAPVLGEAPLLPRDYYPSNGQ